TSFGGCLDEAAAAFCAGRSLDAQGLAPAPDHAPGNAPPGAERRQSLSLPHQPQAPHLSLVLIRRPIFSDDAPYRKKVNKRGRRSTVPFGGQKANDQLYLVAFVDSGTVERDVAIKDYRVSAGVGLRLTVPMLGPVPIALDFGFPVLKRPEA